MRDRGYDDEMIEEGRCSGCGAPAERGTSGAWWHSGTPCRGRARFVPGDAPLMWTSAVCFHCGARLYRLPDGSITAAPSPSTLACDDDRHEPQPGSEHLHG